MGDLLTFKPSVHALEDRLLPAVVIVTNTNDAGPGSLRKAILDANELPGGDNIDFDIPGPGPHSIKPLSQLPSLTDPVVIDGTSQPGLSRIELDGSFAGPFANGLVFTGNDNTVIGLAINRFGGNGLVFFFGDNNKIEGNFIGIDRTGTQVASNGLSGVLIARGSNNNMIGGTPIESRNVISGNLSSGVAIMSDGNKIQNNFIGTDVTGTVALGNGTGIACLQIACTGASVGNMIGGVVPGTGNVISGNLGYGLELRTSITSATTVQGNKIGTDVTGLFPLGNGGGGVLVFDASANALGGTTPSAINVIAFNGGDGVLVAGGTGVAIRRNSIFLNGGLGIRLEDNGNNNQKRPRLNSATSDAASTTINGTLAGSPNTTFVLDFFSSGACDPSGFGEGEKSIGSVLVTTDAVGRIRYQVSFDKPVTSGSVITATATDPQNNTSEFSACRTVTAPVPIPPAPRRDVTAYRSEDLLIDNSPTWTRTYDARFMELYAAEISAPGAMHVSLFKEPVSPQSRSIAFHPATPRTESTLARSFWDDDALLHRLLRHDIADS